ncbi:MAG: Gmad2 immunoglobulin-like domain-containing protein [Dehalococcoidia bacterium]
MGWLRAWLCRLLGCPEERIIITTPAAGVTISSPVSVSGVGQATQHNQLAVEVRDASNTVIGMGTASVSAPLGQRGPFSASVTFTPTTPGSPGFVQVYDTSPATGSVTHLAAVLIRF